MKPTTTASNPSPGSLKIENFLSSKGIKFRRIDDDKIIVPVYGDQGGKVALILVHSSSDNTFDVTAKDGVRQDSRRINEVMRFLNFVNSVPRIGCFYLCDHCDMIHFRHSQKIDAADLSDAVITNAINTTNYLVINATLHVHLITGHGKTAEEAFKELMSYADDSAEPKGGAQ